MGDFTATSIKIGGDIPSNLIQGDDDETLYLCDIIEGQEVSLDWGDEDFFPKTADDLMEVTDEKGVICLYDDQARDGQLEDLEAWLIEHDIAFDRECGDCGEYDAELVQFRPGMKEPVIFHIDSDGLPTITESTVRELFEKIDEAQKEALEDGPSDAYLALDTLQEAISENIQVFIKDHMSDHIPVLEPVNITRAEV